MCSAENLILVCGRHPLYSLLDVKPTQLPSGNTKNLSSSVKGTTKARGHLRWLYHVSSKYITKI